MISAKDFWDKAAGKYAKDPIRNMDRYAHTVARTKSYLRPDHEVLEIGAGTATTAIELAPHVAHLTVTDISPAMIEIGRDKARSAGIANMSFLATDTTAPDLQGPYDVVLAHNVLHLVENLPETLTRIHALLKPGGLFISKTLCRPEGRGPAFYYAMRLAVPVMQAIGKAPFVAFLGPGELERLIARTGFDILEADNFFPGELRRYIVARKVATAADEA